MLLAVLRFVGRSHDSKARAAIKAVADLPMPVPNSQPNYQLIGEAASEVAATEFRMVLREKEEEPATMTQGIRS